MTIVKFPLGCPPQFQQTYLTRAGPVKECWNCKLINNMQCIGNRNFMHSFLLPIIPAMICHSLCIQNVSFFVRFPYIFKFSSSAPHHVLKLYNALRPSSCLSFCGVFGYQSVNESSHYS